MGDDAGGREEGRVGDSERGIGEFCPATHSTRTTRTTRLTGVGQCARAAWIRRLEPPGCAARGA